MAEKKNILTYAGLKQYEDELQNLKVVREKKLPRRSKRQENRAIYQKMQNMMQQKMNREISSFVSKNWKNCLKMQKLS